LCPTQESASTVQKNFLVSDFIAVDIDHSLTVNKVMSDAFVKSYASIFYTTPSHIKENNLFRLIFEFEREIESADKMKNAYNGISKKLGGDPACKDACRMLYGTKNSRLRAFNRTMTNDVLNELTTLNKTTRYEG